MSWVVVAPALVSALLAVLAPGLIATAPLRMGAVARVAVASLASVCCAGVAAAVFGALGAPFHVVQVLAVALVGLAASLLVRRAHPDLVVTGAAIPPRALAAVWALAAAIVGVVAFAGVPDPSRISQTYDNVFHLSAVSAILDGFSASPLTLRSLIETGATGIAYYPSAWHALVAMTVQGSGVPVPVAFNVAWLAVQALVWLPGVAWLAQVVLPGRSTGTVALVALPLGAAFGAFPYALLSWGTIYPTGLAHALLPAAVALSVLAVRGVALARPGRRGRAVVLAALSGCLSVGALAVAHPRVLPTWALIGIPFVAWVLGGAFARARRRGGRERRRAVIVLVAGVVGGVALSAAALAIAILRFGLLDEPIESRLSGPQAQAVQGIWEGVVQVLTLQAMTGEGGAVTTVAPFLAFLVIVGAGVALRTRRTRWLVVAFVLVAALFVLAAGSDGVIAKLATGVWYKDRFRLAAALPVVAVPLATLGALALARRALPAERAIRTGGSRRALPRLAAPLALAVAVVSAAGLALTGTTSAIAAVFAMPDERAQWEVVSQKQIDFMDHEVAEEVPASERVLGDPWDGSALTQLYAGREPVFPHVNGQWDPLRQTLAWGLMDIDSDPAVCRALDALRVRHVLYNPHEFGGGDPAGNHFPGPHAAVEAGLFTEVATDGESTLYRIDRCGPLPAE
ncbi:hypothetical protein GCM10017576_12680 [Microbacterium barkeri]|uniref:Uncharacterized protein n=1 Tax=Microbacterium barkeri TaxID=33917 RepID=A0A9W6H2X5_9MICO|nr:DUF6541 family protein [Microbacterium barkeri]MDR6876674.1 hypothetical protein [Microbacterium barkeri]GLJ61139.1 hypothetical protein GCM10017576_12680 [Microbacterium barkeri]